MGRKLVVAVAVMVLIAMSISSRANAQEEIPADCGAYAETSVIEEPHCGSPGQLPEGVYDSGPDDVCPEGHASDGPNTLCYPVYVSDEDLNGTGYGEPLDGHDGGMTAYIDTKDGIPVACRPDASFENEPYGYIRHGEEIFVRSDGSSLDYWREIVNGGFRCYVGAEFITMTPPAPIGQPATELHPATDTVAGDEVVQAETHFADAAPDYVGTEAATTTDTPEVTGLPSTGHGPQGDADMTMILAYGLSAASLLFFGGMVAFFWWMASYDDSYDDAERRRKAKPRFESWDSESQDDAAHRQPPFLTQRLARPGTLDQVL